MTHRDDGDAADAVPFFERANDLLTGLGRPREAGRLSARLGEVLWMSGRPDAGAARMEQAMAELEEEEPDRDSAMLAAQMGRILFFLGRLDDGRDRLEAALRTGEALWLPEVLSEALNTKALVLDSRGRPEEALGLLKHSLELALEGDVPSSAVRAYTNLSNHMLALERWDEASTYREAGGKLAERVGIRGAWWFLQQHAAFWMLAVGHWKELSALAEGMPDPADDPAVLFGRDGIGVCAAFMSARRGRLDDAQRFAEMFVRSDTDVQSLATAATMDAELSLGDC